MWMGAISSRPTELVDKDGQEIPWPKDAAGKRRVPQSELADGTVAAAKTALDYVLRKTKDEKRLHGIVWHRTQGIPATQDKRDSLPVPRFLFRSPRRISCGWRCSRQRR